MFYVIIEFLHKDLPINDTLHCAGHTAYTLSSWKEVEKKRKSTRNSNSSFKCFKYNNRTLEKTFVGWFAHGQWLVKTDNAE